MSKQVKELRYACNLEADNVKTDEEKLIVYAHYENMLNAIGETNESVHQKTEDV